MIIHVLCSHKYPIVFSFIKLLAEKNAYAMYLVYSYAVWILLLLHIIQAVHM